MFAIINKSEFKWLTWPASEMRLKIEPDERSSFGSTSSFQFRQVSPEVTVPRRSYPCLLLVDHAFKESVHFPAVLMAFVAGGSVVAESLLAPLEISRVPQQQNR